MTVTAQNQVSFKLHNGVIMPGLGFGTFASDAGSPRESYDAVRHALATGYRHMDCAWFYGNEAEVGEAVRDFLAENPSVKRSDIFITTKVWNHRHEPEAVKANLETALKQFGLDYVDMYMVHWPIAAESQPDDGTPRGGEPKLGADGKYIINKELTENPEPTWRAMEELYDAGKTKAIGVSNWTVDGLKQLLSFARVKPHANQIECHPFLPNDELVEFCKANDVLPVAYSPLGSQDQVPSTGERVRDNAVLNKVAEERGFTLAQVLLAWGLKRGCAVLPKSGNPGRIQSNFQIPRLDEEGFQAINGVAKGRHIRFVNMKDTFGYNVWPEEPGFEGL